MRENLHRAPSMATLLLGLFASKEAVFISFLYKIFLHIRCTTMGRICFLLALCSVFELYVMVVHGVSAFLEFASNLRAFLTYYIDFGCGLLRFWWFSKFSSVLVLLFMLFLGFKVFRFNGDRKFRKGLLSDCSDGVQKLSFKPGAKIMSRVSGEGEKLEEEINEVVTSNCGCNHLVRDDRAEEELEGCCDEDQVFDVMSLRKMVKVQRRRANSAEGELEKERMASSTAAEEAMAMILRFQNDRSSLQMQLNQLERTVEEKELHKQSVIESLEWIIIQHEYKMSLLEEELRICREKLGLHLKDEEWDQFDGVCTTPCVSPSSSEERNFDNVRIHPLEHELSPIFIGLPILRLFVALVQNGTGMGFF